MTHGTRTCYVNGCHCESCKHAEAAYKENLRRRKLAGKVIMGAIISAAEAKRLLDRLHREQTQRGQVAKALGQLHSPQVKVHTRITVRKHLKIKRLSRLWLSEGDAR